VPTLFQHVHARAIAVTVQRVFFQAAGVLD
jgi:hypothetical protein